MSGKLKIWIVITAVVLFGFGAFVLFKGRDSSTAITSTIATSTFKTYKNEEWGFEFEYSNGFILKENIFGSYYSKFNLEIFEQKEGLDSVLLLNIVLPKFVDTAFWKSQRNISKVIIDGVEGTKYEYEYEGSPQTDVILPFGEYKIILGTGDGEKQYLDELNHILSSFHFLNKQK
jgi:hypothetical protein